MPPFKLTVAVTWDKKAQNSWQKPQSSLVVWTGMHILNEWTSWNQLDYKTSRIKSSFISIYHASHDFCALPGEAMKQLVLFSQQRLFCEKIQDLNAILIDRNFHSEETAYSSKWITHASRPSGLQQTNPPSLPAILLELSKWESHRAWWAGEQKSWLRVQGLLSLLETATGSKEKVLLVNSQQDRSVLIANNQSYKHTHPFPPFFMFLFVVGTV